MSRRRIILAHRRCLGDVVAMTALVRDLALLGGFEVAVDTSARPVWDHNPHLAPLPAGKERRGWEYHTLSYGDGIRQKNGRHFLMAWHADFKKRTGITVPLTLPRPDLHLSPLESQPPVPGKYWVVLPGGKTDFTTKHPVLARVQTVVDALIALGLTVVQAGSASTSAGSTPTSWNPLLAGVVNLVGQTGVRDFFRLIAHAQGVLCTITAAMHIAAAFQRPCVVWAGGREEPSWESYSNEHAGAFGEAAPVAVPHRYLHTAGLLPCCPATGAACWKNKVVTANGDHSVCRLPVTSDRGQVVARCQDLISAERILENVLWYYQAGWLTLPAAPNPEGRDAPHRPADHGGPA